MPYATDYTTLLTGSYWSGIEVTGKPVFVTYSFDSTAPASDQSHLSASAYATFTPFTAAQQTEAQQALAEWSANSGVVFLQVAPGQGDINFASYNFSTDPNYSGAGGIGFYPFGNWNFATYPYFAADNPGSGNILMNTAFESSGQFAYATVLHEIGHALGLKEPDQAWTDFASNPPTVHNQWDPNVALSQSIMNEGGTNLTHLQPIDIQAIQSIYGTAANQGSMDSSWSWNSTTDTLTQHLNNSASLEVRGVSTSNVIYAGTGNDTIFAIGAGTNTVYAGSGTDVVFGGAGKTTIYAGTGADTFDGTFGPTTVSFAKSKTGVTVNLLNGTGTVGSVTDTFRNIHSLVGSNHGDVLVGDNAGDTIIGGAGNNTLTGGTGNDVIKGGNASNVIYGGGGADMLTGGGGTNRFLFEKLSDSTVAKSGRTTITNFSTSGNDQIDLSALAASLNETLTFIGSAAFSGVKGQVRYAASGANTLVELDSSGKGKPTFEIMLKHSLTLSASDFILSGSGAAPSLNTLVQAIASLPPTDAGGSNSPLGTSSEDPLPSLASPT
jgi:Ca2+-binding RTX toxin-like protein